MRTDLTLQLRHAEYALKKAPTRSDVVDWHQRIRRDLLEKELRESEQVREIVFDRCVDAVRSEFKGAFSAGRATRMPDPHYENDTLRFRVNVAASYTNKFGSSMVEVYECTVRCETTTNCFSQQLKRVE